MIISLSLMLIILAIIFSIIICHWVFDFVFQTHWQATNKSTNNKALLQHTGVYSICWFVPIFIIFYVTGFHGTSSISFLNTTLFIISIVLALVASILFVIITFIAHTITDYFTSRLNSKLWAKKDVHNFFVSVGFDQCLHYFQLFLTFVFIYNYFYGV